MTSPERSSVLAGWSALMLAGAMALTACSPPAGIDPTKAVSATVAPAIEVDKVSPVAEPPAARIFAGLQDSEVAGMLGDPDFVWTEGNARMWRYDARSCSLLVFLYPDGVRHAEVLGGAEDACLCEIHGGCT